MKRIVILLTFLALALAGCAVPTAQPPPPTPGIFDLAGTHWTLERLTLGGVTQTPGAANVPTLVFGADGQLDGTGGCNHFSGRYSAQGEMLSMRELVRTEMACAPSEVMTLEDAYFSGLNAARMFEKRDNQLSITFGEGGGTLLFQAR